MASKWAEIFSASRGYKTLYAKMDVVNCTNSFGKNELKLAMNKNHRTLVDVDGEVLYSICCKLLQTQYLSTMLLSSMNREDHEKMFPCMLNYLKDENKKPFSTYFGEIDYESLENPDLFVTTLVAMDASYTETNVLQWLTSAFGYTSEEIFHYLVFLSDEAKKYDNNELTGDESLQFLATMMMPQAFALGYVAYTQNGRREDFYNSVTKNSGEKVEN